MKKHINDFTKRLDSIKVIEPWHRIDFFENLKSCHIETEESGQKLLVCDLNTDQDICIKMNDQEDAWDISARWIEEDKDENPERYVPDHLKDLPEDKIETLRKIHKPRWRKNG